MTLQRGQRKNEKKSTVCSEGWQAVNELTLNTNTHTQILACLRLLETVKYSGCLFVSLECVSFHDCDLAEMFSKYCNI